MTSRPDGFDGLINPTSVTIEYVAQRELPKTTGNKYPGAKIAKKFKIERRGFQIVSQTPLDFITVGGNQVQVEYWKPIASEDWVVYNSGDELVEQEPKTPQIYGPRIWLNQTGVSTRYKLGDILIYGNKQYRCTNRKIDWKYISDKEFMRLKYRSIQNPYSYSDIQLWTLLPSDPDYSYTYSSGTFAIAFFWYDIKAKAFYSLPDSYGLINLMKEDGAETFVDFSLSLLGIRRQDKTTSYGGFSELASIVKNTIPPDQLNFTPSIQSALISYYAETFGVSPEAAADAVKEAYGKKKPTGKVNIGGGKGGKGANNGIPSAGRSVGVRGSFREGYAPYDGSDAITPQMVQQYRLPGFADPVTRRYSFILRPNQISYSNIGSEWTDIPRSGAAPLVDWKAYKLMQVAFQFVVVPDREGNLDILKNEKEITLSVDDQLRVLQEMASAPYPIVLLGFDDMLTNEVRFPFNSGRGVEFVITEFAVSSIFRTGTGAINRAQCDITLREVPVESIAYIDFPALKFPKIKSAPKPKSKPDKEGGALYDLSSTRIAQEFGSLSGYDIKADEKLDVTPG